MLGFKSIGVGCNTYTLSKGVRAPLYGLTKVGGGASVSASFAQKTFRQTPVMERI